MVFNANHDPNPNLDETGNFSEINVVEIYLTSNTNNSNPNPDPNPNADRLGREFLGMF